MSSLTHYISSETRYDFMTYRKRGPSYGPAGGNYVPIPGDYYAGLSAEAYQALVSERSYGR